MPKHKNNLPGTEKPDKIMKELNKEITRNLKEDNHKQINLKTIKPLKNIQQNLQKKRKT